MISKDKEPGAKKYQAHHILAVQLRYQGLTHKEIAEHLAREFSRKVTPDTLRAWFRRDGYLNALYSDYAHQENEQMILLAREKMKKMLPTALEKLEDLLKKRFAYSMVGEPILDEEGNPVEKLDQVTHKAIVTILQSVGFKLEDMDTTDPVDAYFDRAEEARALPPPSQDQNGSQNPAQ